MEGAPDRPLRLAALALLCQAGSAFEVDSYYVQRIGGAAMLPSRTPVLAFAGAEIALALLVLCLPRRAGACLGLVLGAATLLTSTPFNSAWIHLLQVVFLALATGAVVRASSGAGRGARIVARFGLFALVLLAAEGVFSTIARSHAVGYSLAARLWFSRYWSQPSNALGYRDVEHPEDGRPKLFVLGDSFVAGVGIADARERFSDRLQVLLGERFQVHNLGHNGSDTAYELQRLDEHPERPDVLVLSYYINDIVSAAKERGHRPPPHRPYGNLKWRMAWFVSRSYLLDFAYWLLPQRDLAGEGRFLANCFTWPDVVARHCEELQGILDWAQAHASRVIAVVFPSLTELQASDAWVAPAFEVFARNAVPAIDVRKLVQDLAPAERVVNANDSHPSALVHARVAEALLAEVEALERAR